jgi:hypothetical protein
MTFFDWTVALLGMNVKAYIEKNVLPIIANKLIAKLPDEVATKLDAKRLLCDISVHTKEEQAEFFFNVLETMERGDNLQMQTSSAQPPTNL